MLLLLSISKSVFGFQIYRICSIALGTPPEQFTWEFYDSEKNYKKIGPIRPVDFYREHIKPLSDLTDMVNMRVILYSITTSRRLGKVCEPLARQVGRVQNALVSKLNTSQIFQQK